MGTREAIGALRTICERNIEFGNSIYAAFVDLEKAFDTVNWSILLDTLKLIGIDWKDRRMIKELYLHQIAEVRISGTKQTKKAIIGQGVRQGCPLSPLLFSIYQERMMRDAMEGIQDGVKVGGRTINEIRFADDQAIIANSEEGLQRIMEKLEKTSIKCNFKINLKITKVMKISRSGRGEIDIKINGIRLEQVEKFKYLGTIIQSDGRNDAEIRTRVAMAKSAFIKKKELLTKGLISRNE